MGGLRLGLQTLERFPLARFVTVLGFIPNSRLSAASEASDRWIAAERS